MFCFDRSHREHERYLMLLEAEIQIAEERLVIAKEKIDDRESKIRALIAEREAMAAHIMDVEQYVRGNARTGGAVMPTQARDWKFEADALEARAMFGKMQNNG